MILLSDVCFYVDKVIAEGGAFAQEAAILIEGTLGITVDQLVTCCGTGEGGDINIVFKDEILENEKLLSKFV